MASSLTSSSFASIILEWFTNKNWQLHEHQIQMNRAYLANESALLTAPTGGGKTLSGFLPVLSELSQSTLLGLHTLYISPLKSLTNDVQRNLMVPIEEMGLKINVETRTGDTSSYRKKRQGTKPPHILLTTPESLMLMLSYKNYQSFFRDLKLIIIDEIHSFVTSKRGDFTALALAHLRKIAPKHLRFGLSATVPYPEEVCAWLNGPLAPARHIHARIEKSYNINIIKSKNPIPLSGYSGNYAIKEIYEIITSSKCCLVFLNVRSKAEELFHELWKINIKNFPIGLYHGSLSKEQRLLTEAHMAKGQLRAVVTTSALELGIDWGDVNHVIQVGAPKGLSRLIQRIGRSNHNLDKPSEATLIPCNRFESLECYAAIKQIEQGILDGEVLKEGSLDVIIQYIVNRACCEPVTAKDIFQEVTSTYSYQNLTRPQFDSLFEFAINGGNSLKTYERYHRLQKILPTKYQVTSRFISQRHRQNIGTILEWAKLKVKKVYKGLRGRTLGEIEEYFVQHLQPGDTFLFSGEAVEFVMLKDVFVYVKSSKSKRPRIPSFSGGSMPLSSQLAKAMGFLCESRDSWDHMDEDTFAWVSLQDKVSSLPGTHYLLIEKFSYKQFFYTVFYTFQGRKVNQTLGMLLTQRMESQASYALRFKVSDYALLIESVHDIGDLESLLSSSILYCELDKWIESSHMLKRVFRSISVISGLTERAYAGHRKTMKQLTFSSDLIFDVLQKYEPNHILLSIARHEVEKDMLDMERIQTYINFIKNNLKVKKLEGPSPFCIHLLSEVGAEPIKGKGEVALLSDSKQYKISQFLYDSIKSYALRLK